MKLFISITVVIVSFFLIYLTIAFTSNNKSRVTNTHSIEAPIDYLKTFLLTDKNIKTIINDSSTLIVKDENNTNYFSYQSINKTAFSPYQYGSIELTKTGYQKSLVTLTRKTEIPFWLKPLYAFKQTDSLLHNKNLSSFKAIDSMVNKELATNKPLNIEYSLITYKTKLFVANKNSKTRTNRTIDDIRENIDIKLFKLLKWINTKTTLPRTNASLGCIYFQKENNLYDYQTVYTFDELNSIAPIHKNTMDFVTIDSTQAVLAKYYGSRKEMDKVHKQIQAYLKDKNLSSSVQIEKYINEEYASKSEDLLTYIYYLID